MSATEPVQKSDVINTYRACGIVLERLRNGYNLLYAEGDKANAWTWSTGMSGGTWQSPAEELAKALALVDGRFEVRRYR